jgi:hypothetical protein
MGATSFAFNIADSLKMTSLEMRNLEDSGHHNLYPFTFCGYPRKTHFFDLGSNFPSFT